MKLIIIFNEISKIKIMGNSLFCKKIYCISDQKSNLCYKNTSQETNQIVLDDIIDNSHPKKKIETLKNYFVECEKELMNNYVKNKKAKKHLNKKKHNNDLNKLSNEKYELMLKRLLEKKENKLNGPKSRETIRNTDKIKPMIDEILQNNNNDKAENKFEKVLENDILIKGDNRQKFQSFKTTDKKKLFKSKLSSKKVKLNYINTFNHI